MSSKINRGINVGMCTRVVRWGGRCALLASLLSLFALLPASASAAASPWWQITTGSEPTNLWSPKDEVQELIAPAPQGFASVKVSVGGKPAACYAISAALCTGYPYAGTAPSAANLQAALEAPAAYGPADVEVTESSAGHFRVAAVNGDAGRWVPPVTATGTGTGAKVLTRGGSGTLVLTITNLGDATASGAVTPITITDKLPAGVSVYDVSRAVATASAVKFPVQPTCATHGTGEVACSFTGELPPYETIEILLEASVTGSPPAPVSDGEVTVAGGNAASLSESQPLTISGAPTQFGIHHYSVRAEEEGGAADTQAGSHPFQFTTTIQLNEGARSPANELGQEFEEAPALPRNFHFELPAGLVGNATALPRCDLNDFIGATVGPNECAPSTAIGAASVRALEPNNVGFRTLTVPVFNLPPAQGEPARFGFYFVGTPVLLDTAVHGADGYRVSVDVTNTPQLATLVASTVTLWGAPGDPRHDNSRGWNCVDNFHNLPEPCARPAGLGDPAFLRLPTSCGPAPEVPMWLEPWNTPFGSARSKAPGAIAPLAGCEREPFEPQIQVEPDTHSGEAPSGLAVHLKVPQAPSEEPEGVSESDVRNTRVALPPGLHINPAAANGLQACSTDQIGFKGMNGEEAVFDEDPASCPQASKLGKVKITSPLLEEPVTGWVYQAAQEANPFHSLLALYVDAEAPNAGVHVKLAGKVETDRQTGQVTTTFDATPQLPFGEFELTIFGGSGAPLATSSCGTYKTTTKIDPWSGGAAATPSSEFQVSGCPNPQPFGPSFSAGTESPLAGAFSPFVLNLTRKDGEGQISRIDASLPPGLTGKLAGIPYCPESAIHQAEGRSNPGEGRTEQASPSCPSASRVGTVRVGAGVGPQPYYVDGSAYLAGPYKGAPLSLVIVTPAVAGPFDLGDVVVRTALYVDPETTQITAKSDPLPTILQGIPLDVRSIALKMDRSGFTLNPTSCEAMALGGTATSTTGQAAQLSNRFQVGGCKGLHFRPELKIRLKGQTRRIGHPALKAVLTAKPGEANIGRAQVNLPHGEFLDQGNLNKTCTKPVLLAGNCPKSTIYGRARAWTPLLDKPLEGYVYLVGGYGYKLPALVAELNGQIKVLLVGKVDSGKNKGIRNTFELVPDAPVSRFVLEMKGGKKYGLLENSENLCKAPKAKRRAIARFTGQNGKVRQFKPVVTNQCRKHKKKNRHHSKTRPKVHSKKG